MKTSKIKTFLELIDKGVSKEEAIEKSSVAKATAYIQLRKREKGGFNTKKKVEKVIEKVKKEEENPMLKYEEQPTE